jgi:hypothetical protein
VRGDASFNPGHGLAPLRAQKVTFNDSRIRRGHDLRPTIGAFHFLRPSAQHMR